MQYYNLIDLSPIDSEIINFELNLTSQILRFELNHLYHIPTEKKVYNVVIFIDGWINLDAYIYTDDNGYSLVDIEKKQNQFEKWISAITVEKDFLKIEGIPNSFGWLIYQIEQPNVVVFEKK